MVNKRKLGGGRERNEKKICENDIKDEIKEKSSKKRSRLINERMRN